MFGDDGCIWEYFLFSAASQPSAVPCQRVNNADRGSNGIDSRQRVLCALAHEEPDRVPLDLVAHRRVSWSSLTTN